MGRYNKKYGYLDKLEEYCKENNVELALRGELIGGGNKGSGNKLNSDAKIKEPKVVWFGVDDLSSGYSVRIPSNHKHNLKEVCEKLGFEYTPIIFSGVFDYDELIKTSNEVLKEYKDKGIILEGLVFRSLFNNSFSAKYINPEYDSKS